MNWSGVAQGEPIAMSEFAVMSNAEQLQEVHRAWAAVDQADPSATTNVAAAVLQVMDAFQLNDVLLRGAAALGLGGAAAQLGREVDAIRSFEQILAEPPSPETRELRTVALLNLGSVLSKKDPHRAARVLRQALAEARRAANPAWVVSASLNLAVAQRRVGDFEGAVATIQRALPVADSEGLLSDLGKLHGNLANILTDDLARHSEAIDHYVQAIDLLERSGAIDLAAARRINLLSAALAARDDDRIAASLADLSTAAERAPSSLRLLISNCEWSDASERSLAAFERTLSALLDSSSLADDLRASIAASLIVLKSRAGASDEAVQLALSSSLQDLPSSPLSGATAEAIVTSAQRIGRPGLYWRAALLLAPLRDLADVKATYVAEQAAERLASFVELVAAGAIAEHEVLQTMLAAPPIPGLASVPESPPEWLGLAEPAAVVFVRLRRALAPSSEAARNETLAAEARVSASSSGDDAVVAAREYVRLADLLGFPALRVDARSQLARELLRMPGPVTRDRAREAAGRMREAVDVADRLPRDEVRALIGLSQVLKADPFGNAQNRVAESIVSLRRALALTNSDQESLREVRPVVQLNLANALSDYPLRNRPMLVEAQTVLRDALTSITDRPESDELASTLHNSLGLVLDMLAEEDDDPRARSDAIDHFAAALRLRERLGDPARILLTLFNALGTQTKRYRADGSGAEELIRLADRARVLAHESPNPTTATAALSNAAQAMLAVGRQDATAVAREALDLARSLGSTDTYLQACASAASIHLRFDEYERAREFCEEGLELMDRFRDEGGGSRYLAQLEWRYRELQQMLDVALDLTGAAAEERWWAVERGAGRIALDRMTGAGLIAKPTREQIVHDMAEQLPPGVCVVYVWLGWRGGLRGMLLRRVGRSIKYAFTDSNISIEGLALAAGGSLSDGRAKFPPIALQSGANLQNQLEWLGEKIVGPLFANVDVRSVSRVVLVTPGAFKDIPWHAVPLSPRTATLGDVADVVEAPSSAILMHLTKRPPSKLRRAVLVACDPYRQLTDHVREIQDAFAALDAQERIILTDVSRPVTLAAVVAELRDADVFHFAGHGVGSMGDPHRSGLALSDGVLSAEVIERTLAGRAPNMVLLSACRTATSGFADTSHVPNLLGALIGAGSRVAVGALWDVPDQAASRMMGEIYRLLPSHGLARAVCEARRALRRAAVSPTAIPGRAGAEFAWAAFDVMGWD